MEIDRFTVVIGYDEREAAAVYACTQSILDGTSIPLNFIYLHPGSLRSIFTRAREPSQSTDFAFSRFLTPYLSKFEGWSVFVDCDFIFTADIETLFALRDPTKSIMVCQHDYTPSTQTKFLGQTQTKYPRKNWSSLMLFNNKRCRYLSPDVINKASGRHLHRFEWLDDIEIGSLPLEWNHLVGEYPSPAKLPAAIHYTIGGPYFEEYAETEFAEKWNEVWRRAKTPLN